LRFLSGDIMRGLFTNSVTPACIASTTSSAMVSVILPFFTWPAANEHCGP
jgi:hypothetical protein